MKTVLAPLLILMMSLGPAQAEDPPPDVEEGFSLLEEGARLIMRGMLSEMEPALRDLGQEFGDAVAGMEPALRELADMVGDFRNYEPPQMLPNGDIIIRRKPGSPPPALRRPHRPGEIDL